jgi:hypothetical protein
MNQPGDVKRGMEKGFQYGRIAGGCKMTRKYLAFKFLKQNVLKLELEVKFESEICAQFLITKQGLF